MCLKPARKANIVDLEGRRFSQSSRRQCICRWEKDSGASHIFPARELYDCVYV